MGDKRPSVRTLDTGEQVTHHPDGTQVLLPHNGLAEKFSSDEALSVRHWLDAEKTYHRLLAVEDKRAAQDAGTPVPRDKSVL